MIAAPAPPIALSRTEGTQRGRGLHLTGLLAALVFASAATYPFPGLRLQVSELELPYATPLLAALGMAISWRIISGTDATLLPRGALAGTWFLSAGIALSSLMAVDVRAGAVAEAFTFAAIPVVVALAVTRPSELYVCLGALYAVVLGLTGYGLARYLAEGRPWVEFHYQEATRNGDSFFLVAGFCASFALLGYRAEARRSLIANGVLVGVTAITGAAVALSLSRGAWLGALAGAAVVVVTRGRIAPQARRLALSWAALALVLVAGLAVAAPALAQHDSSELSERVRSLVSDRTPGNSNAERMALWRASIQAIPRWGWVGTGVERFADAIPERERLRLQHGHNMFLHTWIELGVLALVGLALLLAALRPLLARAGSLGTARVVLAGTIAGWVVNGVVETPSSSVFFWAVIGLGLATVRLSGFHAAETRGAASCP